MGGEDTKGYSDALQKLVKDRQDLSGAVAYALYKADKRDYIRNNGLTSGDEKIKEFHKIGLGQERVVALRREAQGLLAEYLSSATADAEKRAQEKFLPAIESVKTHIDKRTGFWTAVGAGVVSTLVFAFVLSLAIWLNRNQQNPFGGLYQLLQEGTADKPPSAASTPKN
jgi:hypothetical protein